ncbi:MAG: D-aminoacyl-tRNA deacylase [Planctomycetota bacterium]|nr:D-aminoacyl-tRNA deacylase [Planctomycetota bacterium]
MRAVIQRVSEAAVAVEGKEIARISRGLLILLGIAPPDTSEIACQLAVKIAKLRIFEDHSGKMNLALADVSGAALVVSQFTLLADARKGNRPSFVGAAPPAQAQPLYEHFCQALAQQGVPIQTGIFGARMQVSLVNDGPVTICLDWPPPQEG